MLLSAALVLAFTTTAHADEAKDLLTKARQSIESKSDQANVSLKIIESNGDIKTRTLKLKTMRDGETYHALARIQSPADIKGTALLAEIKNGAENQWLYLPSSRQVRRVVSGQKSAGVLGSELSPEDMNSAAIKEASVKLVKKDAKQALLEVTPKAGTSEYTKVLISLAMPEALPEKMEYLVGEQTRKTVEFMDYGTYAGKVRRAQKIVVKNLINHRGTEVDFTEIKVNSGLSATDFNVSNLKRDE